MTENKQFKIINDCGDYHLLDGDEQLGYDLCSYSMRKTNWNNVVDKLNEQDETIKKQNQEITACYDTLTTIHELCNAVLNYDFKDVNDKVDFCHMLNEMDNKDLAFLKECFEAIKNNDLKQMTSLTIECNCGDVE